MNSLAHKEPVMMRGTEGALDYHMLAFKGRFGIGFKMLGMRPGVMDGVPGTVHYAIRIRAAKLPEELYQKIASENSVVAFADPDGHAADVFGGIEYSKRRSDYASTILSGFFSPDFKIGDDNKLVGADDIRNGKARQQFLDYMKKAFEGTGAVQILSDDEALEIMDQFEQMVMKQAWQHLLTQKIGEEEKKASVGVISSQNDLAVKIKKKMEEIDPSLAAAPDQMKTVKQQTSASDDFPDPDADTGDDDETGVDEDED